MLDTYSIKVFDDGNAKYQDYPNLWTINQTVHSLPGKRSLVNKELPNIKIQSISVWKIESIDERQQLIDRLLTNIEQFGLDNYSKRALQNYLETTTDNVDDINKFCEKIVDGNS